MNEFLLDGILLDFAKLIFKEQRTFAGGRCVSLLVNDGFVCKVDSETKAFDRMLTP